MSRIALILMLAIVLLPARSVEKPPLPPAGDLLVTLHQLPLDSSASHRRKIGPLLFMGAWHLDSPSRSFGGISSMTVSPGGNLIGLSDGGLLFGLPAGHWNADGGDGRSDGSRSFIAPLPVRASEKDWPSWRWDSESLTHDPVSGRYWVGFELINRICRYAPAFARIESCTTPKAMRQWPDTGGAEAMVRLDDGRFLVLAEFQPGAAGGTEALLFAGDPADLQTAEPSRLSYVAPTGYRATDAVLLSPGRLLVLNRRVTLAQGFTAKLALVDLPASLAAGTVLRGREIATFASPVLHDNFEALAMTRRADGRAIIWIASDDNHNWYQRSLLLKLMIDEKALPEANATDGR